MPPKIRSRPLWFPVPVTQPAAGADWTLSVTGQGIWVVRSIVCQLLTSAVVATRAVTMIVTDSSNTYFRTVAGATQAASLTRRYAGYAGSAGGIPQGTVIPVGWPTDGVVLTQGSTLQSVTEAIDPADQWSQVVALIEEIPAGFGERYVPGSYTFLESES